MSVPTNVPARLVERVVRLVNQSSTPVIDDSPVTVQEYQAFVADELQQQHFRQPDHWPEPLVPGASFDHPVLGARPHDAQAFCIWLSSLVSTHQSTFRNQAACTFRLPTTAELGGMNSPATQFGVWSTQDERIVLSAHTESLRTWGHDLVAKLQEGYDTDLSCDFDLTLHRRVSKNTTRDAALERARNRNPASEIQLRLRERKTDLRQVWDVVPERFRDAARQLRHTLTPLQKWWPDLHLYMELARDLDRALKEAERLPLIQAYLLCVHLSWDLSAVVCRAEPRKKFFVFGKPPAVNDVSAMMQQQVERSFALYAYIAMMNLRRQGNLPCWEGIRIVCDSPTR